MLDQGVFKFHVVDGWEPMDEDLEAETTDFDLNALKVEELDLMAADKMQVSGDDGWAKIDITVDSGAAHSVADGGLCWPSIRFDESEGSRAGSVYLGPGKEDF